MRYLLKKVSGQVFFVSLSGENACHDANDLSMLAKELNAEYASVDEVLDKHGLDQAPTEAECIPAENFIKADEIIFPEVKQLLGKNKPVIFDGCFYHKEHIEHLIKNLSYPHHIFTLKASLEICIERDKNRNKVYGEGAACAVHYLVSKFDSGIVINTENKTAEETLREVIASI